MGLEFVKTYGHHHPRVSPKLRYTYPEMYEVLKGDAFYLLQPAQNEDTVDEVILVKATRGDKVTAPTSLLSGSLGPESHFENQSGTACPRTDSYYRQFLRRLCWQQEVYRHHRDCRTGVGLGVMAHFEFDKADSSNPKSETLRFDFDIDSIQKNRPPHK